MIVSVAVVAYNEEKTLPRLLEDICAQDYPHEKMEVLLIDSMSTDRTRELMESFAKEEHGFKNVRVYENTKKNIPAGHNVALNNYIGDAIVRIDAHASISADFVAKNVMILESGEKISGGQVESILSNDTTFQRTLLIAENSVFCGGIAAFRRLTERAYVDTMAFALYRREVFKTVGQYNELLPRSEDNDMNYRVRQAGFKMCFDPAVKSKRYTRSSFKGLMRQKYLNGYWIGKTMGVNPHCFSLFHFVPFGFVLGILVTTLLAALGWPQLAILMWILYALAAGGFSVLEIARHPFDATNLLLPFLFLLLHLAYGSGTLIGLIELPFWLKKIKKEKDKK